MLRMLSKKTHLRIDDQISLSYQSHSVHKTARANIHPGPQLRPTIPKYCSISKVHISIFLRDGKPLVLSFQAFILQDQMRVYTPSEGLHHLRV